MNVNSNSKSERRKAQKLRKQVRQLRQERRLAAVARSQGESFLRNRRARRSGNTTANFQNRKIFKTSNSSVPVDTHNAHAALATEASTRGPLAAHLEKFHKYIAQCVRPDQAADLVTAPCSTSYKAQPTKINTPISMEPDAQGNLSGRFMPGPKWFQIANTTQLTLGAAKLSLSQDGNGTAVYTLAASPDVGYGYASSITQIIDGNTVPLFPLLFDGPTTNDWIVTLTSLNKPTYINFYDSVTKAYDASTFVAGSSDSVWEATTDSSAWSHSYNYFNLEFETDVPDSEVILTATEPSDGHSPVIDLGTVFVPQDTGVALPASTQTFRTTALAGLITYEGSTLNDQGSAAMAYTDPAWHASSPNWYNAITIIADKRYQGKAKKGLYGWWNATNLSEETPQDLKFWATNPGNSALYWTVKGLLAGQTTKVECTTIFEFYSADQLYQHIPSQSKGEMFSMINHMMNRLPHVSANDDHDVVTKGVIGKLGSCVKKAAANPVLLAVGAVSML